MTSRDQGLGLLTTCTLPPDLSFAIVLELQDDKAPTASYGKARTSLSPREDQLFRAHPELVTKRDPETD